jgi:hypothetical protein
VELGTPNNFPVFCRDFETGHNVNPATQHVIRNDLCGHPGGIDGGRDNHVGIEDNQAHSN